MDGNGFFEVEAPKSLNDPMSAVGIIVMENGSISDEYYSQIDPETHFYYFNIKLTGISEEKVYNSRHFRNLIRSKARC